MAGGTLATSSDEQAGVRAAIKGRRMRFVSSFSSHNGVAEWQRRELYDWATDLFVVPEIEIKYGCTSAIRAHLRDELSRAGWSYNVRIDPEFDLTVTGIYR